MLSQKKQAFVEALPILLWSQYLKMCMRDWSSCKTVSIWMPTGKERANKIENETKIENNFPHPLAWGWWMEGWLMWNTLKLSQLSTSVQHSIGSTMCVVVGIYWTISSAQKSLPAAIQREGIIKMLFLHFARNVIWHSFMIIYIFVSFCVRE